MKAVILAGGLGSRFTEETVTRPKPMIEIGARPILWHIMKIYAATAITDFVVCLGYKGYVIKEFFANYYLHSCDVTFDLASNAVEVHQSTAEPWRVTLVDTGAATMTGGGVRRGAGYRPRRRAEDRGAAAARARLRRRRGLLLHLRRHGRRRRHGAPDRASPPLGASRHRHDRPAAGAIRRPADRGRPRRGLRREAARRRRLGQRRLFRPLTRGR